MDDACVVVKTNPFSPTLAADIRAKVFYAAPGISEVVVDAAGGKLTLTMRQPLPAMAQVAIEDLVRRMATRTIVAEKVLESYSGGGMQTTDPHPEAIARGLLWLAGPGTCVLGDTLSRLFEYFDAWFTRLAGQCQAESFRFPTLIPSQLLARVDYFKSFPHSLSLVYHLPENIPAIERFSTTACCAEDGKLNVSPADLAGGEYLLSPAVCFHYYQVLAGKKLDRLHVATAIGKSFRYESGNMRGLERLWDFSMREIIFVGREDDVLAKRQFTMEALSRFTRELGLAGLMEKANDPFFVGNFSLQASFQSALDLKYELRLDLPYQRGTLAVGSFNYHQAFFGKAFDITLADGAPVRTACTAFGVERWLAAVLAQYGCDPVRWPEPLRLAVTG
ncbi:MAG: hypothetical protein A2107_09120 [Verrucomicrobia bacterium GWF2_62_7]|nr:MAG: hypothetical protein A2107_09120 [Verrucomicrobia bacterium GWF2_62_7]